MNQSQLKTLNKKLNTVLKEGRKISFNKDHSLFYEGHSPYGIYVLHSGQVRFVGEKKSCRTEHIRQMPHCEVIGIDDVIDGTPHCCTCIAETDCEVTFISNAHLTNLLIMLKKRRTR